MPVIIDIREDLRYKQGKEEGVEEGRVVEREELLATTAEKMLQNGIAILMVQNITGLPLDKLEEIAKRTAPDN